ncbi:TIGR02587 family membrane protein [filamentous cyanobacterium CCP2]|nr:TIGR02587 family membrane protein [filamentous cyanobacterium CCP2]
MARRITFPDKQEWKTELEDLVRGASGGFLFGIPLLYTMEAWWIGSETNPPLMLGILAFTFLIAFLLNRTDGFRQVKPDRPAQALRDSIDVIAIGAVCTALVLTLLQQITMSTPLDEALGKVVIEGMPFTIGAALAGSTLLTQNKVQPSDDDSRSPHPSSSQERTKKTHPQHTRLQQTLGSIGATLVGAIIIAFNIAPTDEVPMLAAAITAPWLLAMIGASLLISYCIVFVAGFTARQNRPYYQGLFRRPLSETLVSYLVSLLAAAFMLWLFHRLNFGHPWTLWLKQTIILGLPATVGGAAGRLAT